MKKQKKQLIFVCILLVVVLCSFLGLRTWNKREEENKESDTVPLIQLDEEQVQHITVYDKTTGAPGDLSAIRYLLSRTEDGIWYIGEAPYDDVLEEAKTDRINEMLESVIHLSGRNKIENADDLAQYGLDAPSMTISLNTGEDVSTIIAIGDLSTAASMYYAQVYTEGEETCDVYLITTLVKSLFDVSPQSLQSTSD